MRPTDHEVEWREPKPEGCERAPRKELRDRHPWTIAGAAQRRNASA